MLSLTHTQFDTGWGAPPQVAPDGGGVLVPPLPVLPPLELLPAV
jgi:hypothetical protein